jgi:hypothetical protein
MISKIHELKEPNVSNVFEGLHYYGLLIYSTKLFGTTIFTINLLQILNEFYVHYTW